MSMMPVLPDTHAYLGQPAFAILHDFAIAWSRQAIIPIRRDSDADSVQEIG